MSSLYRNSLYSTLVITLRAAHPRHSLKHWSVIFKIFLAVWDLHEAEFESDRVINLGKEMSRQLSIQTVALILSADLSQVYNKTGTNLKTESFEKLEIFMEKAHIWNWDQLQLLKKWKSFKFLKKPRIYIQKMNKMSLDLTQEVLGSTYHRFNRIRF